MIEQSTKAYGIYHCDTFESVIEDGISLVGEADTIEDAETIVREKYGDRINHDGADQVDIVNSRSGNIVRKFPIC